MSERETVTLKKDAARPSQARMLPLTGTSLFCVDILLDDEGWPVRSPHSVGLGQRSLSATIVSSSGDSVCPCTVVIDSGEAVDQLLGCKVIDSESLLEMHRAAATASAGRIRPPLLPESGEERLPALLLCRAHGLLFRAPCGRCGKALDEHHTSCEPVAPWDDGRAWSEAFSAAIADKTDRGDAPCGECPLQVSCLGDQSDRRWMVLSRPESRYLVTEGGSADVGVIADWIRSGAPDQNGDSLLMTLSGSGVDTIEMLALCLRLFREAAAAVAAHFEQLSTPHLAVSPDAFVVLGTEEPCHPWHLRLGLRQTSSSRRLDFESGGELVRPGVGSPWASQRMRLAGSQDSAIGLLKVIDRASVGHGIWSVHVELQSTEIASEIRRDDQLMIYSDVGGRGCLRSLTRVLARHSDRIELSAELRLDPETEQAIVDAKGELDCRFWQFPRGSLSDDLHSLGVLLLRIIGVTESRDLAEALRMAANLQDHDVAPKPHEIRMKPDPSQACALAEGPWRASLEIAAWLLHDPEVLKSPRTAMARLDTRLEHLDTLLRDRLFDLMPRRAELARVVDSLLAQDEG